MAWLRLKSRFAHCLTLTDNGAPHRLCKPFWSFTLIYSQINTEKQHAWSSGGAAREVSSSRASPTGNNSRTLWRAESPGRCKDADKRAARIAGLLLPVSSPGASNRCWNAFIISEPKNSRHIWLLFLCQRVVNMPLTAPVWPTWMLSSLGTGWEQHVAGFPSISN